MADLTPRHESLHGSNFSGLDGDTNRNYTLAFTGAQSSFFIVTVQGAILTQGYDFTLTGGVITLFNPLFDSFVVSLDYFTSTGSPIITTGMFRYISANDAYRASGLTTTEVSLADMDYHIQKAEEIVCKDTKMIYWDIGLDKQTASSGSSDTLTLTGAAWGVNDYEDYFVWIYSGKGANQIRMIESNTVDTLTVDRNWTTIPDNTSKFRIFYVPFDFNPFITEYVNGNGMTYQYSRYYPLQLLEALTITGITVTTSNIFTWTETGRMELKSGAEYSRFQSVPPQSVYNAYWYGVNYLPQYIKRLVELQTAIQALNQYLGSFSKIATNYTLPEGNVSIAGPTSIKTTIDSIQKEYDNLIKRVPVYPIFG